MPNDRGVLRLETFRDYQKPSGTVRSKAGILRAGQWQHVAAVVERGTRGTRLYVNGYEVASGNIQDADLDDPAPDLHIGRVPAYSVVVPGSLPGKPLPDGSPAPSLYCAVIVKRVDAQTRSKTSINDLLRD